MPVMAKGNTVLTAGPAFQPPNTYDQDEIAKQGRAVQSKGVNPDGSVPGYVPTLDPSKAGDKWTSIGVSEGGLNLTYVVPSNPAFDKFIREHKKQIENDEIPHPYGEKLKQDRKFYGVFETDEAAAAKMNSIKQKKK